MGRRHGFYAIESYSHARPQGMGKRRHPSRNAAEHVHPPDLPTAAFVKAPTVTMGCDGSTARIASAQIFAQLTLLLSAHAWRLVWLSMKYDSPSAVVTARDELLSREVRGRNHNSVADVKIMLRSQSYLNGSVLSRKNPSFTSDHARIPEVSLPGSIPCRVSENNT